MNPETGEHVTAIGSWKAPSADGAYLDEMLVSFDEGRAIRVLILPALFDEANRMRRFTIEVMRRLNVFGIDKILLLLSNISKSPRFKELVSKVSLLLFFHFHLVIREL